MGNIVIGLGETGRPLYEILKEAYPETVGYDPKQNDSIPYAPEGGFLHICIPYTPAFKQIVGEYQKTYLPKVTIIHSTVPIGTTAQIENAVHSPIRGKHDRMKSDLQKYVKWVGGPLARSTAEMFRGAGFSVRVVHKSEQTEAMKLLCLAKYGMSIAFAYYCSDIADKYDFDMGYLDVYAWDAEYNKEVEKDLRRPLIVLQGDRIGGHCVIPNTKILNEQYPNPILQEVLKYE